MFKVISVIFVLLTSVYGVVVADYRMDECYWLDNAGGIIDDVREVNNSLDGTSHGTAQTYIGTLLNKAPICTASNFKIAGDFVDVSDNPLLTTTNTMSLSLWMRPLTFGTIGHQLLVNKTSNYSDGFSLYTYWSGATAYLLFQLGNGATWNYAYAIINPNVWLHVVGTYDGSTIRLYVDGVQVAVTPYISGILNVNTPLLVGQGVSSFYQYLGSMDEVKVYNHTLTALEVKTLYTNELAGNNYNGIPRVCPTCGAGTKAGIWGLTGIPADVRIAGIGTKDVANVFDEFPVAVYGNSLDPNGWAVFKRDYNATNNASAYSLMPYTGLPLEFGQGYWLASNADMNWTTNTLANVDYNSTNIACVRAPCVEIDLTSVNLNFAAPDNDINDGSGRNRNNMLGFVGEKPINWADCRLVVTDVNGTIAYTPTDANLSGIADKQVWQYNPGAVGTNANGYTTCDDTIPGGCKLEPYKGFWIVLYGKTKNKTVKLLIPKE